MEKTIELLRTNVKRRETRVDVKPTAPPQQDDPFSVLQLINQRKKEAVLTSPVQQVSENQLQNAFQPNPALSSLSGLNGANYLHPDGMYSGQLMQNALSVQSFSNPYVHQSLPQSQMVFQPPFQAQSLSFPQQLQSSQSTQSQSVQSIQSQSVQSIPSKSSQSIQFSRFRQSRLNQFSRSRFRQSRLNQLSRSRFSRSRLNQFSRSRFHQSRRSRNLINPLTRNPPTQHFNPLPPTPSPSPPARTPRLSSRAATTPSTPSTWTARRRGASTTPPTRSTSPAGRTTSASCSPSSPPPCDHCARFMCRVRLTG